MTNTNRILERKYYALDVELASPLNLSGGVSEYTDSDVLVNGQGEVFVPGTSLAGAFRTYYGQKQEEGIFGYSQGEEGAMSAIWISDMYFTNKTSISVRDGIKLDAQKRVVEGSKFDMEIIETGAAGTLFIKYIRRENDDQNGVDYDNLMSLLIGGIGSGEIRIGANKTRGFGRLKINKIYESSFNKEQTEEWLALAENEKNTEKYQRAYLYKEWVESKGTGESKFVKIKVPLKLQGGISIRKYSTRPKQADYEHITCNGKAVIPGSSWNGAIRAEATKILQQLGVTQYQDRINDWFGYVNTKKGEATAKQSQIVICESILNNAKPVPMTRNNINRFSGATVGTALYSEISYFGGTTELEIMIRKFDNRYACDDYKALVGMMLLVINSIKGGYLPVGGQAAIGRGVFTENPKCTYSISEDLSEDECLQALYSLLYEVK